MKIVIIGTGNVATVLARKLKLAGHSILQVYGRNEAAAAALAAQLSATACSAWTAITQEAELYIVSVADNALESVAAHLLLKDQLVVHTAGAVSMQVFKNVAASYGVLYPFQTIRKDPTLKKCLGNGSKTVHSQAVRAVSISPQTAQRMTHRRGRNIKVLFI